MADTGEVVLEGFHVCKHAVRFGAEIVELVSADMDRLQEMLYEYAPDIHEQVLDRVRIVNEDEFARYSDVVIRTPLAGRARVPVGVEGSSLGEGLIVCLENPRDLENIGAVVRLAAGMNCAGVITTGDVDPWHKNCLRGSQGLHFAVPVVHVDTIESITAFKKPLVVFDESGQDSREYSIPENAILVFGSERRGVSPESLEVAETVLCLPQGDGVSSYNLATSVAMGLYHREMQ